MTQDEFLERLWNEVVKSGSDGKWIDAAIKDAKKSKNDRERKLGHLLKGMVDKGVTRQDIVKLLELDRSDTVFSVIMMVEEGELEPEAWEGIHEAFDSFDSEDEEGSTASPTLAEPVFTIRQSHHVAFSPDAKRVVTATGGKIWDVAGGKELGRVELPPHTSSVAWSPSGKVIAMQSTTGAIRFADASKGKKIGQVKMTGEGTSMAFSRDGKILAAGDWNGELFVWSVPDGKLLHQRTVSRMIRAVVVTDEQVAVVAGAVAVGFDRKLDRELWRKPVEDVLVSALHLAGDDRLLVEWRSGALLKTNLKTGKAVANRKLKLEAGKFARGVTISPDGQHICGIYGDDFILLDSALQEKGRRRLRYPQSATFSPDSKLLAVSTAGKGEIWRVDAFPKE